MVRCGSSKLHWLSSRAPSVVLASAAALVACARPVPMSSARDREPGASLELTSGPLDAGPSALDPAAKAAAREAVILHPAATMLKPSSLPGTAALPPAPPPTATPGAAETLMPVVPPGGATPLLVPAETPVGIPLPPAWDGGAR